MKIKFTRDFEIYKDGDEVVLPNSVAKTLIFRGLAQKMASKAAAKEAVAAIDTVPQEVVKTKATAKL